MTPPSAMPKDVERRRTAFLVAPRSGGGPVYAVLARRADEALEAVRALGAAAPGFAVVGALSSRTARTIRLRAGRAHRV